MARSHTQSFPLHSDRPTAFFPPLSPSPCQRPTPGPSNQHRPPALSSRQPSQPSPLSPPSLLPTVPPRRPPKSTLALPASHRACASSPNAFDSPRPPSAARVSAAPRRNRRQRRPLSAQPRAEVAAAFSMRLQRWDVQPPRTSRWQRQPCEVTGCEGRVPFDFRLISERIFGAETCPRHEYTALTSPFLALSLELRL